MVPSLPLGWVHFFGDSLSNLEISETIFWSLFSSSSAHSHLFCICWFFLKKETPCIFHCPARCMELCSLSFSIRAHIYFSDKILICMNICQRNTWGNRVTENKKGPRIIEASIINEWSCYHIRESLHDFEITMDHHQGHCSFMGYQMKLSLPGTTHDGLNGLSRLEETSFIRLWVGRNFPSRFTWRRIPSLASSLVPDAGNTRSPLQRV